MRSMKLLVATAVVAALVAGPVLAQDAMTGSTPAPAASTSGTTPAKHMHKKRTSSSTKQHHTKKKAAAPAAAPAETPAQ